MPKRDHAYMQAQREAIARAALEVVLEKGIYATSLREICKAAGVSIGGLYSHFATKEEVIVAACALNYINYEKEPVPNTWADYLSSNFDASIERGSRQSKRLRLSLQLVAELTQLDRNPEGLSAIYDVYRQHLAKSLLHLQSLGIIRLPWNTELVSEMHMQIFAGANYRAGSNPEVDLDQLVEALHNNLAITAGLVTEQQA